tara:strand:- start:5813 stop:6292 length:480 start_codon:yes stop_codon:yes gene_type:complete
MTERDSKLYSLKYFYILKNLLSICDKYEISEQDHILNYGKSVLVYDNYKRAKPIDKGHRELRRIQVAKSILSLVDILDDLKRGEVLSEYDIIELDDIVNQVSEGEILKNEHIKKGNLVLCDGYINQIADIDYDDFKVKLVNSQDDVWFWESPSKCKKAN